MKLSDLVIKITSRKFWALIASLVVSILTILNFDENVILQITGLITTLGSVITYIIGETVIDKEKIRNEVNNESKK